jgi:hypothetical protein
MRKKTDELVFTHDSWTRDASGMPERFAEELSPRKKKKKSCTSHEMKR